MKKIEVVFFPDKLTIYQFNNIDDLELIPKHSFFITSKTDDEISVISTIENKDLISASKKHDSDWMAFKVNQIIDFDQVGLLSRLSKTLAEANISILAHSTFNTDFIFFKKVSLEKVISALLESGCGVSSSEKSLDMSCFPSAESKPHQLPITQFSMQEFGLDYNSMGRMKRNFPSLPYDMYDVRRMHIELLQKNFPDINQELISNYYMGISPLQSLDPYVSRLSLLDLSTFNEIKPYRKRSIAEFKVNRDEDGWSLVKQANKGFSQLDAAINQQRFDIRKLPRKFIETQESIIKTSDFRMLILGIASKIGAAHPEILTFNIVAHHTYVEATLQKPGDNSPEGRHQDGYDYIASAFVVDRENISGGVSQIFRGPHDKKPFFESQLQCGQGILQPDKNSSYWHSVTPFFTANPTRNNGLGSRSTIGFDIDLKLGQKMPVVKPAQPKLPNWNGLFATKMSRRVLEPGLINNANQIARILKLLK